MIIGYPHGSSTRSAGSPRDSRHVRTAGLVPVVTMRTQPTSFQAAHGTLSAMHAVVAIFRVERPQSDEYLQFLRERIVPAVSQEPGFIAGYWINDGERSYNTLVFDSREAAESRAADVRGNAANQVAAGLVAEQIRPAKSPRTALLSVSCPSRRTEEEGSPRCPGRQVGGRAS
jgi:hypothetical protein